MLFWTDMHIVIWILAFPFSVFSKVFQNVVDSCLQRLDGGAYLAQLGIHLPFNTGLSHCDYWKVAVIYKAFG